MFSRKAARGVLLSVLVLTGGLASQVEADTIVLTPADDRRARRLLDPPDGMPDDFHLQFIGDLGGLDTVTLNLSEEERFAMEFALGALPGGAVILSSVLTLHLPVAPLPAMNSAEVHGYAGDGTVQGDDLFAENFLASFHPVVPSFDISIGSSFLQELLLAGEGFAGLALRNVTIPQGTFTLWNVDGPAATRPTLTIEYEVVPEPSTLVLVGCTLAVCGRRLRAARKDRGPRVPGCSQD
jgi:hypothetical protein